MTDAVIAWVDGDDPNHRRKRNAFLGNHEDTFEDIAGTTRYRSTGEIFFCIASILRFAPWMHKIYIVTDAQNPHVEEFVQRNFPGNTIPIEIVDHKVLFRGYEKYLPTFNSLAIATMLWRIPGLCDRFVYFNDDVFLTRPISEEEWFDGDVTLCRATRWSTLSASLARTFRPRRKGHKPFGHKDAMLNTARLLKKRHFWLFPHAPLAMRSEWFSRFYAEHPDLLDHNIRHRFRDASQFSSPNMFYLSAEKDGTCRFLPGKDVAVFIKSSKGKKDYMKRKLHEADNNPHLMFGCVNSLEKTTPDEQAMFRHWMEQKLNVTFE